MPIPHRLPVAQHAGRASATCPSSKKPLDRLTKARVLLALLASCCATHSAFSADYYVPGDYTSIQAAVDDVDPGDRIYVLPGTYAGFRYNGNAVTVESLKGPNITIVSGSVRFWDGEPDGSKLIGFKIVGGNGDLVSFSSNASGTASGYVENCILANSTGTGISIRGSGAPRIVQVDVSGCSIGIQVRDTSAPSIEDSHIHDNASRGIDVLGTARPALYRCRISGNDEEGIAYASPVSGSLDNCIIDHSGEYYGVRASGLLLLENASISATNCVVDNNMGYGCELRSGSTSTITNCIVTNNGNIGIFGAAGATPTVTYTCLSNNVGGSFGGIASAGVGCIFRNPRFVQGGNYHLSDPASPCIDTGDPAIADFARPPGLGGVRSDMGAFGGGHNNWLLTLPPPNLLSPADGATCVSAVVVLDWSDVAGATGYMVNVGDNCGFGSEYEVVASGYQFSGDPGAVYYWRVKTKDSSGGFGNYTSCFSYETDPGALVAPVLGSPANGAVDQPVGGILDWSDVVNAASYRVQLGTTCGLGDEHDVAGSSYAYAGLDPGTTYYWRVRTKNECGGWGPYSGCFTFATAGGEPSFVRSDVDGSGEVNISDPLYNLAYQFAGGPPPDCLDAADSDDSGEVNISDPLYELAYQFAGGPEPPAPFPACGPDPTEDPIDCASFPLCGSALVASRPLVPTGSAGDRVFFRQVQDVPRDVMRVNFGVETSRDLAGFEFTAAFDPRVLGFLRLVPAPGVDLDFLSASGDAQTATVRVGGLPDFSMQSPLRPGAHLLGTLEFRALDPSVSSSRWVDVVTARFVFADRSQILLQGGDGLAPATIPSDAASARGATGPVLRVPSPYRPNGVIQLSMAEEGRVDVAIFDVSGRRVRTLLADAIRSGEFSLYWDGAADDGGDVHTGMYCVQARLGGLEIRRKILLVE